MKSSFKKNADFENTKILHKQNDFTILYRIFQMYFFRLGDTTLAVTEPVAMVAELQTGSLHHFKVV